MAERIQRWVMGSGGFIGEVSLYELCNTDDYVRRLTDKHVVELTNLFVHPLRRRKGWADELLRTAVQEAAANNWAVFLRVVPYGKQCTSAEQLTKLYLKHGFRTFNRVDPREMILR